jgi:indolepyruvate ferredoxin oxidoreductase
MMLGYAWQTGLIPVGHDAIEQAIRLNGVAIEANLDAFRWGRMLAYDPEFVRTHIDAGEKTTPQAEMTLEELIAHREMHLTGYQNAELAKRYRAMVEKVRTGMAPISSDEKRAKLVRAVAQNYAKLLAYKDEYEVARLFTSDTFRSALNDQFSGKFSIAFNLAPPMLSGENTGGRPKKREFGPHTMKLFRLLTMFKGLRGTAFDPFGYSAERKAERALIKAYEDDVALVLEHASDDAADTALALLTLPDKIRGFGPVKEEAMTMAAQKRVSLRQKLAKQKHGPAIANAA